MPIGSVFHAPERCASAKPLVKQYEVAYVSNAGMRVEQRVFAPSMPVARADIQALGGRLLHIRERPTAGYEREHFTLGYKTSFLRAMNFHVLNGMSSGKALALVIQKERNDRIRAELQGALDVINAGGTFNEAFSRLRMFNGAVLGMLQVGELAQDLPGALAASIDYLEQQAERWKLWKPYGVVLLFEVQVAIGCMWAA
jgi:type II secretory pathway component PulF